MSVYGVSVSGTTPEGINVEGQPEGMQIVDGEIYMTIRLKDKSLARIKPPKGFSYSTMDGWRLQ